MLKIKQQKDEMDRSIHENSFLRQQIAVKQQRSTLVDIPEANFFNSFASPTSSIEYSRNNNSNNNNKTQRYAASNPHYPNDSNNSTMEFDSPSMSRGYYGPPMSAYQISNPSGSYSQHSLLQHQQQMYENSARFFASSTPIGNSLVGSRGQSPKVSI